MPKIRYFVFWILLLHSFLVSSQQEDTLQQKIDEKISHNAFGATGKVSSGDFNRGHIIHPYDLIRGRMAGLTISKAGSNPNGLYELRVRGIRSMVGNNFPAIVIDGAIGAFPENVDPGDIESVTLLKDAASSSLYGLRGGSGVLIIETKSGSKGKPVIEYNTSLTAERVAGKFPAMDAGEWNALNAIVGYGTDFGQKTHWREEITHTALTQVHNISLSGGGNNALYRASFNFRDGDGIMINTGYSQLNGRINLSAKALKQRLTVGMNLGGTQRKSHFGFSDACKYALISNPTAPVYSGDPFYDMYGGYFQEVIFDYYNPVSIASLNRNEGLVSILNVTANASYSVAKGVSVELLYALQDFTVKGVQYLNERDYWGGFNRNGIAARQESKADDRLFTAAIRYDGKIGSGGTVNLSAGYSDQKIRYEGLSAEGDNFDISDLSFKNLFNVITRANGLGEVSNTNTNDVITGLTGSAAIDINKTWFFGVNGKYDGSSQFATKNKWSFFGGIYAGIDMAGLFQSLSAEKILFRIGYGTTGNLLPANYLAYYRLGTQRNIFYSGHNFPETQFYNVHPDLKSQVTREFNSGIDFVVSGSKLSGSFDFYTATVHDPFLLISVPVPPNLYPLITANIGKLRDTGLELSLNYSIGSKKGITWNLNLSASYNLNNSPVSFSGTIDGAKLSYGINHQGNLGSPGHNGVPLIWLEEGKPFGELMSMVYKETDENGNTIVHDLNHDGSIDHEDRTITGNALPKSMIGLGNTFTYGKWDLNFFFRGVFGHDLVNTYRALYETPGIIVSYNPPESVLDEVNPESANFSSFNTFTDREIESASFLCLDNLTTGFTFLPAEGKRIKKFRAYIAGNNLFYLTKYKGIDPNPRYGDIGGYGFYDQLIPGIDRINTWYRTRSVTLGMAMSF